MTRGKAEDIFINIKRTRREKLHKREAYRRFPL